MESLGKILDASTALGAENGTSDRDKDKVNQVKQ